MILKNVDIYLSRLISALCLFLILAEANIWLDPVNNAILVLGYRLFIIFTPLLFLFFKHKLTFIAFLLTEIGLVIWLSHYTLIGTTLFAVGISVSGYMLKYYSSFSTRGAAGNKIALNLGSIISGIMVAISQDKYSVILFCLIAMLLSMLAFSNYFRRENIGNIVTNKSHFSLSGLYSRNGVSWAIIGFVIGVKLIAIVSILPQFLINANNGKLPVWYGSMLVINSLFVVIFQIPIMKRIKNISRISAILPLFIGMIIISFSSNMRLTTFGGALIWTLSLSLIECTISYLDKLSQDDGLLLIKESAVGLGSAATVFFVRYLNPLEGSELIGIMAIILLFISAILFNRRQTKFLRNTESTVLA